MPTRLAQRAGRARPRVVIDTNVWISAWLSSSGTPAQVVRRAVTNADVIFTDATFDELQTRVWRPKFDRYLSLERRRQLLHDAAAIAHWAVVTPALAQKKNVLPRCRRQPLHPCSGGRSRRLAGFG